MTDLLEKVLVPILIPVIPLVSLYIITFLKTKIRILDQNYYTLKLEEIIETSVLSIQQTYVDALKNKGVFTKEAQTKAFNDAKESVLSQLEGQFQEVVSKMYVDYNKYIEDRIEALVKVNK